LFVKETGEILGAMRSPRTVAVGRATVEPRFTAAATNSLVVPLGRFAGADHRAHLVDTDHTVEQLSEESFAVWRLAHGPLDPILAAGLLWTRTELTRYAALAGVPDPAALVADLLTRRLLDETPRRGAAAERFARNHRAVPLMFGLGNSPDLPHAFAIGYFDRDHVMVTETVFEVWANCGSAGNLWQACLRHAPDRPEEALARFLEDVHRLLVADAVYLAPVTP
jgi:hypothetical protein